MSFISDLKSVVNDPQRQLTARSPLVVGEHVVGPVGVYVVTFDGSFQ